MLLYCRLAFETAIVLRIDRVIASLRANRWATTTDHEDRVRRASHENTIMTFPPRLLIDRLADGDRTLTRVVLDRPIEHCVRDSFEELLEVLASPYEWVTAIHLGPHFYASISDDNRSRLLRTLPMGFPQLQVLTIGTLDYTRATMDGRALGDLVAASGCLQTLRCERRVVLDEEEGLLALAEGFRRHASLQRVTLPELHPLRHADDTALSLTPLAEALRTVEHLESLQLGVSTIAAKHLERDAAAALDPAGLAALGSHPQLKWLVVRRFALADEHVAALLGALTTGPSRLQNLDVEGYAAQATGNVWHDHVCPLLSHHCHLESLTLPATVDDETRSVVDLYLALNRAGRASWRTAARHECLDLLAPFMEDLSMIYILVSENPLLLVL